MTDTRPPLLTRLEAVRQMLVAAHAGGVPMSSASKGREREDFVSKFLATVFPAPYRFGDGDIIDSAGAHTGQLDLVVENPFAPSVPMVGGATRLYLAEGVGAVVEVKSDLAGQWNEVLETAQRVRACRRQLKIIFGSFFVNKNGMRVEPDKIPVFAVGYRGWKTEESLFERVVTRREVDGILVLDSSLAVVNYRNGVLTASGPAALWYFVLALHQALAQIGLAEFNGLEYARPRNEGVLRP